MENDLIVVQGNLYSYYGWDGHLQMHKVAEVDIDEDGIITATYIPAYFTEEEMQEGKMINLTQRQWIGLAEYYIRNYYSLEGEKCAVAAKEIIHKGLNSEMLSVEKLLKYITEYLKNKEGK